MTNTEKLRFNTMLEAKRRELAHEIVEVERVERLERRAAAIELEAEAEQRRLAETELQKYRDHLERLIEDRTADLKVANRGLQQEIVMRRQVEQELQDSITPGGFSRTEQ